MFYIKGPVIFLKRFSEWITTWSLKMNKQINRMAYNVMIKINCDIYPFIYRIKSSDRIWGSKYWQIHFVW